MNKWMGIGNLTRDPEVRYTPSGTAVCDIGLAVNKKFKNKAGELEEQTTFVDLVAWGKTAEVAGAHLVKGSEISVEGELEQEVWVDKSTQKKRSRLRVRVDRFGFLRSPKE